jgi:hypothetical protein
MKPPMVSAGDFAACGLADQADWKFKPPCEAESKKPRRLFREAASGQMESDVRNSFDGETGICHTR